MFFIVYILVIYITRLSILAQMNAFYMEEQRKSRLLTENLAESKE
jgi:hypothetical protein